MKPGNSFILPLALLLCLGAPWASATMADRSAPLAATGFAAAHMRDTSGDRTNGESRDGSGAAEIEGMSPTYVACRKSAHGKLLENDACMSSELKYQDARLNKAYKGLLGVLKPDSKKALVEAERTWLQSKAADEAFESSLFGDTQVENAQQTANKLYRLCIRANALDKYLALAQL